MAARYLNIIKEFSQSELREFFEKNNNLTLYEEIVNKAKSLDGETFLNLTEFQMVRWKLSPSQKQKLLKFLDEVKKKPQNFVKTESTKDNKLNRRESIYKHENIKKQLEQVICGPNFKPPARNESNPSPLPSPATQTPIEDEDSTIDEYLEMDQNNEIEQYYDEGYLKPNEAVKLLKRAPLALPRDSDGGYIHGPQPLDSKPPELPPRTRLNVSQCEDSEEDIYEPVEDEEKIPFRRPNFSSNNVLTYDNSSKILESAPKTLPRPLPPVPTPVELSAMVQTLDVYENTTQNKNTIPKRQLESNKYSEGRSYQMHMPSKTTLPLPPKKIPQLNREFMIGQDEEEEEEDEEDGPYGNYKYNVNNEPFYRKTDRKGAKMLLEAFGEGAFLFRPSLEYSYCLSLKHNDQIFHLGIEKVDQKFRLNTEGKEFSPEFSTLSGLVDHFSREYITFKYKDEIIKVLLQRLLPPHVF